MLSGQNDWKLVIARVSSNQQHVVISLPMSVDLSRSDVAFALVASTQGNVMVLGEDNIRMLLQHHS
eukprot:8814456-Ditylum_brightwellii.AAC.1